MQATVALLVLVAALTAAKPPPPAGPAYGPGAPPAWAAFMSKPAPLQSRALVGLDQGLGGAPDSEVDADPASAWPVAPPAAPASAFLKLKPAVPTFMPPVVDPSKFISMKAALLNSLFPAGFPGAAPMSGAAPPPYSLSTRALFSPFAAPPPPAPGVPVAAAVKPPPPAFLGDLFKALGINKTVANASEPVGAGATAPAYPGVPVFPAAPIVDPGIFISKKAKFLSDLFAGLATTTPAPPPTPPPTPDAAGPAALNAELAASLQRLLDSLSTSATAPQDVPEDEPFTASKVKRAADSAALVADAKDKVVDTIIGELAELKNDMVGAVTDLALAQKASDAAAAAAAATAASAKKPVSPYAAMWAKPSTAAAAGPTPKPPPAVEPVRQKVVLLGQVFDMLTDMEKDITSSMVVPSTTADVSTTASVIDVVKAKINQMMDNVTTPANQTSSATAPRGLRLAPAAPPMDPTFWIPDSVAVAPDAYLAKTKEFIANIMAAKSTPSPVVRRSYKPYSQDDQYPQRKQQTEQPQQDKQTEKFTENPQDIAFAYQQQRNHHHHHNRQPFWWN